MLAEILENPIVIPLLIVMFFAAKAISPIPNYCEPITAGYEAIQELEGNLSAYNNYRPKFASSFAVSKPCEATMRFLRIFNPIHLTLSIVIIGSIFLIYLRMYLAPKDY